MEDIPRLKLGDVDWGRWTMVGSRTYWESDEEKVEVKWNSAYCVLTEFESGVLIGQFVSSEACKEVEF